MNKIIVLLGTLTLVVSLGARASTTQEIFDRLDNSSAYNSLNAQDQAAIDNMIENTVSNLEDQGITLTDAHAQMLLFGIIDKLLGLSKGKEDAKKMPPPAEPMPASEATGGNAAPSDLSLSDANAHYGALWDAIKGVGSAVADKVGSLATKVGDKLRPKSEETAPATAENSLNNEFSLDDGNAHYGALWDAIKGVGAAVADKVGSLATKVGDKLKPKTEEPASEE